LVTGSLWMFWGLIRRGVGKVYVSFRDLTGEIQV
jgi:hypothetical protein